MIYSIIPNEQIFPDSPPEISYIRRDGIVMETENGQVRRIISTNPSDYLTDLSSLK